MEYPYFQEEIHLQSGSIFQPATRVYLPETDCSPLKIGHPKRKRESIQTINFQGLLLLVSGSVLARYVRFPECISNSSSIPSLFVQTTKTPGVFSVSSSSLAGTDGAVVANHLRENQRKQRFQQQKPPQPFVT